MINFIMGYAHKYNVCLGVQQKKRLGSAGLSGQGDGLSSIEWSIAQIPARADTGSSVLLLLHAYIDNIALGGAMRRRGKGHVMICRG